jgi:hypothetical protein
MPRKPTQPALYELIRQHPNVRGLPSSLHPADLGPVAPAAGGIGGPGRFVKLPVGYVYAAIAAALVVVVAAYVYGHSVGERAARERYSEQRLDELSAAQEPAAVDPMQAGRRPPSLLREDAKGSLGSSGQGTPDGSGVGSGETARGPGSAAGTPLGPASGLDPRQEGLNYFVLAHTDTRTGEAMVQFCRQQGLDAHLVPDENGEPRRVIATPGFAGGERRSPEVTALQAKIREIGRKWKAAGPRNRDFGDSYPMKFQPRGGRKPADS